MLSDKEITEGIASDKNHVLNYVYNEMFPYVEAYVIQQGGTKEQAKDLFQEAMIVIYQKISSGNLKLHCKFSTFLYAVCKRIWIQDRKKYYLRLNKMQEIKMVSESESIYGKDSGSLARELFDKHFKKLGPDCQQILTMYFNGLTIEEISKIMGINTIHHASDKKYRCKKSLIERIKADPLFRKLKHE